MLNNLAELEVQSTRHSVHSTLRERIVEHVFVGDALRRLWQLGVTDVEVLRSEFDAGGYDLVMSYRKVVRHIQLKSAIEGGKAANVKVSLKLMEKPSGCVLWVVLSPKLVIKSYRWFGGRPGKPLPDIRGFEVAKHTKGNAEGIKLNGRTTRSSHEHVSSRSTHLTPFWSAFSDPSHEVSRSINWQTYVSRHRDRAEMLTGVVDDALLSTRLPHPVAGCCGTQLMQQSRT